MVKISVDSFLFFPFVLKIVLQQVVFCCICCHLQLILTYQIVTLSGVVSIYCIDFKLFYFIYLNLYLYSSDHSMRICCLTKKKHKNYFYLFQFIWLIFFFQKFFFCFRLIWCWQKKGFFFYSFLSLFFVLMSEIYEGCSLTCHVCLFFMFSVI